MNKTITSLVLLLSLAFSIWANQDPVRQKARYYFLQGSIEAANDNMPAAFEYFKKAYEIDPSFKDAAFTYGSQRLFTETDTLQSQTELKNSLALLQSYVDENPRDLYATQMYGYVTARLDTVEEAIRVYERVYDLMPRETQILLHLAEAYMMKRRTDDAIKTLDKYEQIEGKSQGLSLKKISYMMAATDTAGALLEVDRLIESNPRDPMNRILKGNLYEVIGNNDSVLAAYKQAERLAPESGTVKMSLANFYRNTGDSVMLDTMVYEALLAEDLVLEDKLSILGDYLQKIIDEKGEKSRGDHLFEVLNSQYPHEAALLDMAARYSAAKEDYKTAIEQISYAIDMDANNERYWLMLASFLVAEQRYDDIIKKYEEAQTHVVPSLALKNLYAAAASQIEDKAKGEEIILSLLSEVNPDLKVPGGENRTNIRAKLSYDDLVWVSSLYCLQGDINYKNGNPDKAFSEYEESLFFFPENALALNNYAYFLSEEERDLEKAKEMSRKSLDLSENNPTYLDTYAWILFKLQEYAEALDYQKLALELAEQYGEENPEYYQHYGEILIVNGQSEEGEKYKEMAKDLELRQQDEK